MAEKPTFIVADYHLDNNENGVDLVAKMMAKNQWNIACMICSADPSEQVRQHTSDADYQFLRKPIKPLALKRFIKQVLNNT